MLQTAFSRQLSAISKRILPTSSRAKFFTTQQQPQNDKNNDDDTFELLPPGCSMVDPTYGLKDSETTVLFYDETPEPASSRSKTKRAVPQTPANLAAAQKQLDDAKAGSEEDDRYVYLPPGSSMRDPGYNSMSDPLDRRVYYRDPVPSTPKRK